MNLVVFSHLRWNFVFQRPQHLMTRWAQENRVFFWEEPLTDADTAFLEVRSIDKSLNVVVPHIPAGLSPAEISNVQYCFLEQLLRHQKLKDYAFWYYTPLALDFSRHFQPAAIVYDCMDELSAFRGAPAGLRAAEAELFRTADVVFTGGRSLYESKKRQHPAVFCFPSSIDRDFFATARQIHTDVSEQAAIPHPRLGFAGVIDERMDMELLAGLSHARPDWHFVMIGPIVKVADSEVPKASNIHYLGAKDYRSLPSYMAGWDVGILPFALNESTRYISPTKTPEYLAAGLPAVSTPITDVVDPYGSAGLVHIASTVESFVIAAEKAISSRNSSKRLAQADQFLSHTSWDLTWRQMKAILTDAAQRNGKAQASPLLLRGSFGATQ